MEPFDFGMLVLRVGVGITFAVHGAQKLFGWWGGPGFAGWQAAMGHMGYRPAFTFALTSAVIEFGGGLLLAAGFLTPFAGAALVAQSVVIIGQVHWSNGFFNAKAGFEFPLVLGTSAVAIALAGPGAISVDGALRVGVDALQGAGLVLAGLVAGLAILGVPRIGKGTTPSHA